MADENPKTANESRRRTPLEERVSVDKRQFLRLVLGSMTAYAVPLMASFSMGGLRIGVAEAQPFPPAGPGLFITNQIRGFGDGPPPPAPPATYRDFHQFDPPPPQQSPPLVILGTVPPEVP